MHQYSGTAADGEGKQLHMITPRKNSAGFSTLDALAALMVLNLLCLGLLTLQLSVLQAQRDAWALQTAVALGQDLWERMQINPQAATAYQLKRGQVMPATDCQSQACTPVQWAESDLYAWQTAVQLRLPGAQTQLSTTAFAQAQLLMAWPMTALSADDAHVNASACPARHRCWQTSWTL